MLSSKSPSPADLSSAVAPTPAEPLPARIRDQAIAWAVKMCSGTVDDADRTAWEAWRAAHPRHEQAWRQVQSVEQLMGAIPEEAAVLAHRTLESAPRYRPSGVDRRQALKYLAVAGIAVALGVGMASLPQRMTWHQRSTYTADGGDPRRIVLADGSIVMLEGRSAMDVVFSPFRRRVLLRQGGLFIETGADAYSVTGRRPFWVETPRAHFEAIGTRFEVALQEEGARLHVTEGVVAIEARGRRVRAETGEIYLVWGDRIERVHDNFAGKLSMGEAERVLVADRMALEEVVRALNRHHGEGVLYCHPDVARLRISGVFRLDGPDPVVRVLNILVQTLPVNLQHGSDGAITLYPR